MRDFFQKNSFAVKLGNFTLYCDIYKDLNNFLVEKTYCLKICAVYTKNCLRFGIFS